MGLPAALTPGTVIGGHYIIGQLINSGGFGAVYRGVDTSEGNRPCAIKETYDVTPAARRQALMEASVLFTVRNQHLPEVYDALEDNGRFYLIMQMIEGENLLQILRSRIAGVPLGEQEPFQRGDGPCSLQEVLAWLLPIMDVLQDLHNRNILHRDIKPGNIILTPDQTTVLVDFGLTRLYDPSKETGKLARAVTEGYSPPEQYLSKTMPQSDIYSMAATIYLLLTNRLPPSALQRTVNDTLIPPRHLNPSLPPAIERALVKALAVQPEQRYQSIREFADALRDPAGNFYNDQTVAGTFVPAATQPSLPSAHISSPSQPALVLPAPPTLPAQPAPMTPAPPSPRVSAPPAAPPAQSQAARQHQHNRWCHRMLIRACRIRPAAEVRLLIPILLCSLCLRSRSRCRLAM
ncbi:MAG: serine/threonine protein kinase [Ktedonobacteraceae bacterium]|nr:serine/threonine protein kinase [Ktedonobacteraceae bacterium]